MFKKELYMPLETYSEENKTKFWEIYPQYKTLFNDFYKADKTKNKERSSKIMWAIVLYIHPLSDFYNIPNKDRYLAKGVIGDNKFRFEDYKDLMDLAKDSIFTVAIKALDDWNLMMIKRDKFTKSQDFTLDGYQYDENEQPVLNKFGKPMIIKGNAEQLDKMLANTAKLYQDYQKVLDQLKQEKVKSKKGSKRLSASDTEIV